MLTFLVLDIVIAICLGVIGIASVVLTIIGIIALVKECFKNKEDSK